MFRKLTFNIAAAAIALAGVAATQWALTHQPPSVTLAVLYPSLLLVVGLAAGLFAYLADPRDPTLPVSSNDHGPVREKSPEKTEKVRVKVRRARR